MASFAQDMDGLSGMNMNDKADAEELQQFILLEQQKAQLRSQIQGLTDICWDTCITDKPQGKLDSKTEACLENCASRFVDVTLFISNRFAQVLQKASGM